MAMTQIQPVPRNGHTFVVGVVARITGGPNQKEVSLVDQIDHARDVAHDVYGVDAEVELRPVATKGKGERLDRPELAEIEAMIRTRELDLLVAEDIGRMVRGTAAKDLCGIAVDHGTRVIAPNDCIDTAEDSWEEDAISACRDHVGHNAHTSKRLKQKLMNRFAKFGGATARPIYGYVVPEGAKTYAGWQKDPEATEVYTEWFRRLRENPNCSAVADWLNEKAVPTGPYARKKTWDGAMVRRVTRNPILKGMPGRGFKHTVKHHETGRRISVKNPNGPKYQDFAHLAHVDPVEFDEVNALVEEAYKGKGRKPVNGHDPLLGVPRKRTRFPGQHARCWYCGWQYVWGGNGMAENLMCNGSRAELLELRRVHRRAGGPAARRGGHRRTVQPRRVRRAVPGPHREGRAVGRLRLRPRVERAPPARGGSRQGEGQPPDGDHELRPQPDASAEDEGARVDRRRTGTAASEPGEAEAA
jgi:hypothetical protein